MKKLLSLIVSCALAAAATADEGMWLLTNPPLKAMKEAYGFEPSREWLLHMQRSCVRFETGGSGSLVSADGLVMTNHHVGSDMIGKLSTKERDLLKDGFHARTRAEELRCPDLELRVLQEIEDVTARVNAAASESKNPAEAGVARRRAIADIESESERITGLKSQVVTLYQGGAYHLYRYKSYTDVRLVFAPEQSIAFFGGDTDNFEFPRFNLDCCFFRIYEDGKPLQAEHYLRWSDAGAKEDEMIFIFGHPGSTRRSLTTDHLRFVRDVELPARLGFIWRNEMKLAEFAGKSKENARLAMEDRFGYANSRKAFTGQLTGLQDIRTFGHKYDEEAAFRAKAEASGNNPDESYRAIAQAQEAHAAFYKRKFAIERVTRISQLAQIALHVQRLVDELPKPSSERLPEYSDAALASTYLSLYSPEPIHESLEIQRLTSALAYVAESLGGDDPVTVTLLAGKSPADRAAEAVRATLLRDEAVRKSMVEGGAAELQKSNDPMLAIARALDSESRELLTRYQNEVEAPERMHYAKIAAAKFAIHGDSEYPDATFTLRMTYGKVTGLEDEGRKIPAFTTLGGTFSRFDERKGEDGFELPASWMTARGTLNADVPFNFICTADIIGGNSGSPVVNTKGEVVGLVFDGNIHSLTGAFIYDAAKNRAVAVDSRGMIEALRKCYDAKALIEELMRRPDLTK